MTIDNKFYLCVKLGGGVIRSPWFKSSTLPEDGEGGGGVCTPVSFRVACEEIKKTVSHTYFLG